ncbi:MAG: nucleoside phosphorylase [Elusimicrobia bacterium]|nr:nucleoside phosphorylase [Elusimicrobiota bacterium]
MKISKIKNKHLLKPSFTASDFIKKYSPNFKSPKTAIAVFNKNFFWEAVKKYKAKKLPYDNFYEISKNLALTLSPIGSPAFCVKAEELYAAGAERIIIFGTAGSLREDLKPGEFVLCKGALIDEGVSKHYVSSKKTLSYPSKDLTYELKKILDEKKIRYRCGFSWTVDAPYRESLKEVDYYSSKGIMTAEMEASSLFSLSFVKRKQSAALFVISDILKGNNKGFAFHYKSLKENYRLGLDLLCEHFR